MIKKNLETIFIIVFSIAMILIRLFLPTDAIRTFALAFLSVLFEALPFILIGSLVSSLLIIFATEEKISKIIPKNKYVALALMSVSGLVFPLCECSIVPITKGLIKKKLPLSLGIAFMVSVPIVNPVVFFSTMYAFQSVKIALTRTLLGILSGFVIGLLVDILQKDRYVLLEDKREHVHDANEKCSCGHDHSHDKSILSVIKHTSEEFFNMGKYLIFAAFISALIKTLVDQNMILSLGQTQVISVVAMMVLAFVLSICSEADAFIARSFRTSFSMGSIFSFMIFGPMMDIKNLFMMLGSFKKSFVLKLSAIIVGHNLLLGLILNFIGV